MSRELKEYQDASKIVPSGKAEVSFGNKPVFSALLSVGLGIAVALIKGVVTKILGAIVILAGLAVVLLYRSRKVLAFYPEGVMAYKDMDDSLAMYFPYKEIDRWSCKCSNYGTQAVVLMKKNRDYVYVETPDIRSVKAVLRRYLPDRELK